MYDHAFVNHRLQSLAFAQKGQSVSAGSEEDSDLSKDPAEDTTAGQDPAVAASG